MVKKHLTLLETMAAYQAFIQSEAFERPNVSKIRETGDIVYAKSTSPSHDYSQDYLTFEILSDGNIGWVFDGENDTNAKEIEYSKNNGAWTPITASESDTIISVQAGDIIRFKGNNQAYTDWDNDTYTNAFNNWEGSLTTAEFNICGNIMSLIYGDNFVGQTMLTSSTVFALFFMCCQGLISAENLVLPATTLTSGCYSSMFMDCTSLISAPALPATTLAENCYQDMFQGCSSLTSAPALPAITLAEMCYQNMFEFCLELTSAPALPATTLAYGCYMDMFHGCTNLTTAPALPATTLANSCYSEMFCECTSLTTAPALPAITLTDFCYECMFQGCTSLTTAPALPATTLAENCYSGMFHGCTNLTTAPALPATTLARNCYAGMFYNCNSLNHIECLAVCETIDPYTGDCLYTLDWVDGVAANGTFVKNVLMTNWETGRHGVPNGWTVQDAV